MFEWIKKDNAENITADIARENNQKYQDELKRKQQEYKLELCDEIARSSLRGDIYVATYHTDHYEFITREYLENDLKGYFESKGFNVKLRDVCDESCYLRISWDINSESKSS